MKTFEAIFIAFLLTTISSFSHSVTAATTSDEKRLAIIIAAVSKSEAVSAYKSARGLTEKLQGKEGVPQLVSSQIQSYKTLDKPALMKHIENRYNYLVSYRYLYDNSNSDDEYCLLFFPIEARGSKLITIGHGESNGGCGE